MKFLDQALNKVIKWENITVSPEELVRLADELILSTCSDDELKQVQKGMKKTWVLAVGSGSSRRYYPSYGKDACIVLDFNILTHTLSKITLQDTKSKREKSFLAHGG